MKAKKNETKAPETKAPETKAPETKAPETKAPETKAPETKAPETKAPETVETKAPETALLSAEQAQKIAESRFASFKNKALALAGIELDGIVKAVGEQAVLQWKVYAEITNTKCYTEDGFKNVSEFAAKYFNEGKSSASHKATVYNRFYSDGASEIAKKCREIIGPRQETLYEYASLTDKELEEHFTEVTTTLNSKEARALAKRIKEEREDGKSKETKQEDTFNLTGLRYTPEISITDSEGNTKTVEASITKVSENDGTRINNDDILDALGYSTADKLFKAKFEEVTFYIAVNPSGTVTIVTAEKHVSTPPASETVSAYQLQVIAKMHTKGLVSDDIAETLSLDIDKVEKIIAELDAK